MPPSPRVVRNFWISGEVDGRRSRVSGGPRARDGGLCLTVYQRDRGRIETSLKVACFACPDGTLRIEVEPVLPCTFAEADGTIQIETKR
jgi:hypothetical protein